ncbi:Vegetative incompatibility protein HET-E-1 [Pseudocercospora fuligena]|uniref:Vegetative incompatibility protein HET-E-1 n=1 Tax=Pseudocercospora fuligena TaxID=685502 RepID=A0A8H6RCZ8_9PEZI|nr:Vegetative incompatibility protein HET-E-1 [Pseudocercospora fuligena]
MPGSYTSGRTTHSSSYERFRSRIQLDHVSAYTVGWLTALYIEKAAAYMMLDERHNKPRGFQKAHHDHNKYIWGRIGDHNVVIASLPAGEYGTVTTAIMATSMLASLPHIKFNLLVGIGAGIAKETHSANGDIVTDRDIRLGDVAVSNPDGSTGGVVQYDFAKALTQHGTYHLQRKGFLNSPPTILRSAISDLQAEHECEQPKISEFLQTFNSPKVGYPGAARDRLRVAEMSSGLRPRDLVKVHYGVIASGNTLIKNAQTRESITAQLLRDNIDPICFEMEAAGLMNELPCLVIRGISDYADEYKNDDWQNYAAATAAAFAKELLTHVDADDVVDVEEHAFAAGREPLKLLGSPQSGLDFDLRQKILDWLCPTDYSMQLQDNLEKCQPGTGKWFLENDRFLRWAHDNSYGTLFCPGDPGNGKTIIATLAINHLLHQVKSPQHPVIYAFCNHSQQKEQTAKHFIASLLRQLLSQIDAIPSGIQRMYHEHTDKKTRPNILELQEAMRSAAQETRGMHIVLDAIDECLEQEATDLITYLRYLVSSRKRFVVVVSVVRLADRRPTPRQIKSVLDHLPTGADACTKAYSNVMSRLTAKDSAKHLLAKNALMWIVHANRPLSPHELTHAVGIGYGHTGIDDEDVTPIEDIISFCDGLITIDQQSQAVRLVHQTTMEYLEQNSAQYFPEAKLYLAYCCLTYLSDSAFASGPSTTASHLYHRIRQWPFLRYAAENWGLHLKDVEQNGSAADLDSLQDRIFAFLTNQSLVETAAQVMDLDANPLINAGENARRSTACHLLAHFDLPKTFQSMPGINRDFNSPDLYGRTPLSYAAQYGCGGVLNLLLKSEEVTVEFGDISQAVVNGQNGIMELLYDLQRIDPTARDKKNRTALSLAARVGQKDQVRTLLER